MYKDVFSAEIDDVLTSVNHASQHKLDKDTEKSYLLDSHRLETQAEKWKRRNCKRRNKKTMKNLG